jgi:predicted dehydrogenase
VDILVSATADHWHAPAAILGCAAGKHVYVEKPCSHNPQEGEWLVEAARKYRRVVQHGTQRRSWSRTAEVIQQIREGLIGRVYYSRGWMAATRPSIGQGKTAPVPDWLDYGLWQGPAPARPYRDNVIHYNWHWFWHWGTGEIGNHGVHRLDICRWGLGVDYPIRVSSAGGRYHWHDDQETPDTHLVTFDFEDGKSVTWENLSCNRQGMGGIHDGISFHGESGSVLLVGNGYTVYDRDNKEVRKAKGPHGNVEHIANFLAGVRAEAPLNAEILEGHRTALMCHLGNIAYRTKRTLHCDPKTGRIQGDKEASAMWGREYAPGWEPKV